MLVKISASKRLVIFLVRLQRYTQTNQVVLLLIQALAHPGTVKLLVLRGNKAVIFVLRKAKTGRDQFKFSADPPLLRWRAKQVIQLHPGN